MFVGPAVVILAIFLVYPIVGTAIRSVTDGGFAENYGFVFTSDEMLLAWRNNILWLVLGVSGSVIIGLLFAALVDRVRREALAKTFVFLPLAISMVGAMIIWRFVYEWRPPGQPQIGILNAIITALGGNPVVFLQTPLLNTMAMIVIMIWLQTGFAMVILSAVYQGCARRTPGQRIDGATELQVFFRIIIPSIRGSIITVTTTIFIAVLKVFDIVYVLTGGNFESQVLANSMFEQMFRFRNLGHASAIAMALLIVVTPVIIINVRNLRRQEDRRMTAAEATPTAERRGFPLRHTPGGTFWNKLPVRISVVLIAAIWTLPTFGLLITSFRPPNEIRSSGWWTVLTNPFMETWTMANYADVFTSEGMLNAFVNSLIVTIPATVIPITMAAFAAYAFAWMKFLVRAVLLWSSSAFWWFRCRWLWFPIAGLRAISV